MTSTRIGVIDHGAGNLVSITRSLQRAGADAIVATTPDNLDDVEAIVLPGVGATSTVMEGIRRNGFEDVLLEHRLPILGICVGMQVLFETSDEDGADCLGLIPGVSRRLTNTPSLPHIGWNDLTTIGDDPFFATIPDPVVYFVHSYAVVPTDESIVTAITHHGDSFVAAVRSGQIVGTQFHPERSGAVGLRMLANFVRSLSPAGAVL